MSIERIEFNFAERLKKGEIAVNEKFVWATSRVTGRTVVIYQDKFDPLTRVKKEHACVF